MGSSYKPYAALRTNGPARKGLGNEGGHAFPPDALSLLFQSWNFGGCTHFLQLVEFDGFSTCCCDGRRNAYQVTCLELFQTLGQHTTSDIKS